MQERIGRIGYWSGLAACAATVSYDIVQIAQVAGVLRFPLDEILIYATALGIVIPFTLQMLALHHVTDGAKRFWSHAAVVFTIIYAVFVTANYVVQLATVLPAKLGGRIDSVRLLDQTPHSLFWNFDAIGYICMGIASLLVIPALGRTGAEKRARVAGLANALVTPLIAFVYFYPTYSTSLLFVGFPWAVTAPAFMLLLALALRARAGR